MKYVTLPDNQPRKLPFYLAMEEYIATNTREEAIFMWQVDPTVIFGRNQVAEKEVDFDYCSSKGIQYYRRKSGGGCVYADRSNIMFSFITTATDIPATFAYYTEKLAAMLRKLGLDAISSGRNDVTINGRKVSGNAFYQIGDRSIVHGTMLYDTDIENMTRAISPSPSKLSSKGVDSVRSHITTLSQENIGIDIETFKDMARDILCDGTVQMTDTDIMAIEKMSEPYFRREWIYGNNPRYSKSISEMVPGVGEFQINLSLNGSRINAIDIKGDFFLIGHLNTITSALANIDYTVDDVGRALRSIDVSTIIKGLSNNDLIRVLFNHS